MNKKLINLAVAAALAAPAAAMAEATLYGVLHQSIDYIDQDDIEGLVLEFDPNSPLFGQQRLVVDQLAEGYDGWSISRADGNILDSYDALTVVGGPILLNWLVTGGLVEDQFDQIAADPNAQQRAQDLADIIDGAVGTPDPDADGNWGVDGVGVLTRVYDRIGVTNAPVGPSNRLGVKGSEDLGNGLKGVYQVEFGIRLSDGDFSAANGDRGSVSMRNTFVGLGGDFGTFLIGRHDTPLKISTGKLDLFADTMADYNGALGFNDIRADNVVAYISPSWSGFQFAGAVHAGGKATVDGLKNNDSDSLAEAWSVAAIYSNGPWYASAAYEELQADMSGDAADLQADIDDLDAAILDYNAAYGANLLPLGITVNDDFQKWRVGLGILDWNGFSLTGIYEDRMNTNFVEDYDTSSWEVQAAYAFGNNEIKAAYGSQDRDLDDLVGGAQANTEIAGIDLGTDIDGDVTQWSFAYDYNFSKRTKAYVLYNNVDDDYLPDWDGFSLGVVHKF